MSREDSHSRPFTWFLAGGLVTLLGLCARGVGIFIGYALFRTNTFRQPLRSPVPDSQTKQPSSGPERSNLTPTQQIPSSPPTAANPATPTPVPAVQSRKVECSLFSLTLPQELYWLSSCNADVWRIDTAQGPVEVHVSGLGDVMCNTGCILLFDLQSAGLSPEEFPFPPKCCRAAIVFQARAGNLDVPGLSQVERALEAHGQMGFPISNEPLRYVVRGFTEDSVYALYVELPLRTGTLPDEPDWSMSPDEIDAYNQKMARTLEGLPATAFAPNLDVLDGLIQSITYTL